MKKLVVALTLLVAMFVSSSAMAEGPTPFAKAGKLGIGLGGSSTISGLSAKFYLQDKMAVQGVLGYYGGYGVGLSADLIFEMPVIRSGNAASFNWHVGGGAGMVSSSYWGAIIDVCGVAGLGLQLKEIPLEFTADLRPTIYLTDWGGSNFWISGGGAIRYFF